MLTVEKLRAARAMLNDAEIPSIEYIVDEYTVYPFSEWIKFKIAEQNSEIIDALFGAK